MEQTNRKIMSMAQPWIRLKAGRLLVIASDISL